MFDQKDKLLDFIGRYLDLKKIEDTTDFISEGLVNSLFAMQLIMFLEERFQIVITNEDMQADNFSSIRALEQFIIKKTECKADS